MFERWRDRDDVTEDDLRELTAEEEVRDWMARSPVPQPRRREWLADHVPTPIPPTRNVGPAVATPTSRWPAFAALIATFVAGVGTGGVVVGLAAAYWFWI